MAKALKINPRDNCAVVLADTKAGDQVEVRTDAETIRIAARQDIALGHKIALVRLDAGQPIVKYGEQIGQALGAIEIGDWIHLHNVTCRRGHENQEA